MGGEIDSWSGRSSLGLLLGIDWGIWLLLLVTRHFPRGWSFTGLPVTDRTRPALYALLGEMLTVLQLVIALVFAFLTVWPLTYRPLPGWWWPAFLGSLFGSQGWYLCRAVRLGRTPPKSR